MSEKRTHDASGLLICQHCGVVLKQRVKNCRDCGNIMSRYSPTVMPVLVIKRVPAASPQRLRPENDPLLVERVIIRCRFNEAMTPKPRQFHGSRAFLSEYAHEAKGNGQNQPASQSQETAALASPQPSQQPSAPALPPAQNQPASQTAQSASLGADFFTAAQQSAEPVMNASDWGSTETVALESKNPLFGGIPSDTASGAEPETASTPPVSSPATESGALQLGSLTDWDAKEPEFEPRGDDSLPAGGNGNQPSAKADESKLIKNAPHPSFMVADMLLLVVQENDGQTLSVTQTVEGPDLEPVFGLLPGLSDFNICMAQETPVNAVCLSANALSFHDANQEEVGTPHETESVLNIDSRLAFEEGLSRISALRLQGALAKSGVLGFENPSTQDDFRSKFTKKGRPEAEEVVEDATADDGKPEDKKPKERSVFKPKRAPASELQADKIAPMPDVQSFKPKKNPMGVAVAAVGIILVLAVVGVVGYMKFGSMLGGSGGGQAVTAGGGKLPPEWHMVLNSSEGEQFQDYAVQVSQSGKGLSGKGRDQVGEFTLSGELTGTDTISLQKQYDSAGYIWPIMFSGRLIQSPNGVFASGTFSWRKSDAERIQGEWQAMPPAPAPQAGTPMQGAPGGQQGMPQQGMQQQGMQGQGMPPQGGMQGMPQQSPQGFGMPGQQQGFR